MKRVLFFSILSIFCLAVSAQTNTWNGGIGVWSNSSQWSLNLVPNGNHDVVIPGGSEVTLASDGVAKSITVQGNAIFTFDDTYHRTLRFTNPSTFSAGSTLNWPYGYIAGGGTLTLNGTTNLSDTSKWIIEGTTIINNGTMNNQGAVTYIQNGTLINGPSGVIDMQTPGGNFQPTGSGPHLLINEGLIKHTSSGEAAITAELHNNGGTISVESGTLTLSGGKPKYLNDGVYNVSAGAFFKWINDINFSGALTGAPQGQIVCHSANFIIPQNTTASLNFTGDTGIVFDLISQIKGSGTLVNKGKITFRNSSKFIDEGTTFQNEGIINITTNGVTYIRDGTLINKPSGIIDMKTDGGNIQPSGAGSHLFINEGLIKHTSTGEAGITAELHNNGGTISVENGTLFLSGGISKYLNGGIYNVAAGARFKWLNEVVCAGTLTGVLDGDIYGYSNATKIPASTTAIFDFTGSTGVVWDRVDLTGSGTLVNRGEITLNGSAKYIQENTTLQNEGIINIESNGETYIQDGTLINKPSGLIDLQADGGNIVPTGSGSHLFINEGLIKHTSAGEAAITAELHNNGGTISVENGTLILSGGISKYLNGGIYNVAAGARFTWINEVVCAGTLTGVLDGDIYGNSNLTKIPPSTTAIFDFTGNTGVVWDRVDLIGSGTLVNKGEITLIGSTKIIRENTTLRNEGIMNFEGTGKLYINDGELKNQGLIDLKAAGGDILADGNPGLKNLINNGAIKKTTDAGTVIISAATTNSGTIDVQMGQLNFISNNGFNNTVDGMVMGIGTLGLPPAAAFTNDGIFSPGGYPGTLTVLGDFKSSTTSELQIEIYDATQGTGYDLLAIQGNAIMDGDIKLALYFAPNLGDEFVVVTANNVANCNLPATITQNHDGHFYTFDVICNPDNVTLKVTNIVLGTETNSLSNVKLFPNPSNGNFTIDLGKEYSDVSVQIYNMIGQLISSKKYASAKIIAQEINASTGIYFVKVSTAKEGSQTLRIIKQ